MSHIAAPVSDSGPSPGPGSGFLLMHTLTGSGDGSGNRLLPLHWETWLEPPASGHQRHLESGWEPVS